MTYHVTKIENDSVYGHGTKHCDAVGCAAGADVFLRDVNPDDVEEGRAYEIDDAGQVLAEVMDEESGPQIEFTPAAQANIDETGADVAADLAALRSGKHTPASLLAHCLDGADPDREQGWRDYVDALAAEVAPST